MRSETQGDINLWGEYILGGEVLHVLCLFWSALATWNIQILNLNLNCRSWTLNQDDHFEDVCVTGADGAMQDLLLL